MARSIRMADYVGLVVGLEGVQGTAWQILSANYKHGVELREVFNGRRFSMTYQSVYEQLSKEILVPKHDIPPDARLAAPALSSLPGGSSETTGGVRRWLVL